MTRACRVIIDLAALNHNWALLRTLVGNKTRILVMIKANAYGHGFLAVANNLLDADALGVAKLNEALILRNASVKKPVVLMTGFYSMDELECMAAHDISVVVHTSDQVEKIINSTLFQPLTVWLKLDSGMHRLGLTPDEFKSAYQALSSCDQIVKPIVMMTHLSAADFQDSQFTQQQFDFFNEQTSGLEGLRSISNSAAILAYPQQHVDWVRPGIMLYGISPFSNKIGQDYGLQPVMSFYSDIIAIKEIEVGGAIGYGMNWRCEKPTRVAVISTGYGDGYPRHAKNGTPVLIDKQICPIIGRVSMDMLTVDISQLSDVSLNSEVVLWGQGLPVEVVAGYCDTISYELTTNISARVEYHYINSEVAESL